jgi:streptogramin lyase
MAPRAAKSPPRPAEITREYGPFPGGDHVRGVTFDGRAAWFAAGERLQSFDPRTGEPGRALAVPADAGTAFDGRYLFQLTKGLINKIDPDSGAILATIPSPGPGDDAGLTWAEGTLWVAKRNEGKIHQIDPDTGAILRTVDSDRFVTGVSWVEGELWHGTWNDGQSDLRRIDPDSGEVLEQLTMPPGVSVTGLESDGGDRFFCGGGSSGKVRVVRRPNAKRA